MTSFCKTQVYRATARALGKSRRMRIISDADSRFGMCRRFEEIVQASLRDAALLSCQLPGVGNAGLLSNVPNGTP